MPNDYCATTDVWEALPDANPSSDTSYDAFIANLITRASRLIDKETHREPGAYAQSATDTETRFYMGSGGSQQWIDEIVAAPSLVAVAQGGGIADSDYTTYSSSDFFLWPYNADDFGKPWRRIDLDTINGAYQSFYSYPKSVKITAPFGYSDTDNTPPEIVEATIIQVARWFGRARQGYQDTGAIAELGQLTYTKRLDPEVQEIVDHFRRVTI